MSFAGHVTAMINSLKANRAALKSGKKNPFDKENLHTAKEKKWVDEVQITPHARAELNQKIRKESKSEKKQELILLLVAAVVGISVVCLIFFTWLH